MNGSKSPSGGAAGGVTLLGSTISTNGASGLTGGGLYIAPGAALTMENSLVAGNTGLLSTDIYGTVTSSDHDLIGSITGYTLSRQNGDRLGATPSLAPLGNYGGATQTMPLLPGSPGIDSGDPASGNVPLSLPGLADWYKAEGNTLDSAGTNNATSSAGVSFAPGVTGQAFSLSGNGYVNVPYAASLAFTTAVSLDAWVNPASLAFSSGYGAVVAKSGNSLRNYGLFVTSAGAVHLSYDDSDNSNTYLTTAPGLVHVGSWTNVAGVIDTVTGVMEIFVNGYEVLSGQTNGAMVDDGAPLSIGASDGGSNLFDGLIDEVQIYNRALTSTDVQTLYVDTEITSAALASSALPGLAHRYSGQGNAADTSGGSSGAAHGVVSYAAGKVGEAFSFGGSSYVSVPNSGSLGYTTAVTLDAWVDPTSLSFSSGYGAIVSKSGFEAC